MGWINLSKKYDIDIDIKGLDALPSFVFKKNKLLYKTFITKFMLDNSFLVTNVVYVSIAHTPDIIKKYFSLLDECFKIIKKNKKSKILNLIGNKVSISGFQRVNCIEG